MLALLLVPSLWLDFYGVTAHMEVQRLYNTTDKIGAIRSSMQNGVCDWFSPNERELIPASVPDEVAAAYPEWRRFSVWAE